MAYFRALAGHRHTAAATVTETDRWKVTRIRDFFFDLPALASIYADIEVPVDARVSV